jgi:hypothetical protein
MTFKRLFHRLTTGFPHSSGWTIIGNRFAPRCGNSGESSPPPHTTCGLTLPACAGSSTKSTQACLRTSRASMQRGPNTLQPRWTGACLNRPTETTFLT